MTHFFYFVSVWIPTSIGMTGKKGIPRGVYPPLADSQ